MATFRSKPTLCEAHQWFKNGDHPDDDVLRPFEDGELPQEPREGKVVRYYRRPDDDGSRKCEQCHRTMHEHGWIDTLEGGHIVCVGDWIVTGVKGERYPCKPDIFALRWEDASVPSAAEKRIVELERSRIAEKEYRNIMASRLQAVEAEFTRIAGPIVDAAEYLGDREGEFHPVYEIQKKLANANKRIAELDGHVKAMISAAQPFQLSGSPPIMPPADMIRQVCQSLTSYKNAIEDFAVTSSTFRADATPKQLIHEAVAWNVRVALDPSVSEEAAKLRDTYLADCDRLRGGVVDKHLKKTADGELLVECEHLYCPHCGGELEESTSGVMLCWKCPNRDNGNSVPLMLFDTQCYSTRAAALAAKEVGRG
jgi:hypothetical protein